MLKTTGARLAAAMLGYFALLIVFVTLNPFYFEVPRHLKVSTEVQLGDVLDNVVLFLPLGFLVRMTGGRVRGAALLGAALSACVELTQLFVPIRATSPVDVASNTLGAALGALAYGLLARRIAMSPQMVGRLSLEIPLMGLAYLTVPLLWMDSLALDVDPGRWPLTALLGACGAVLLAGVYRGWGGAVGLRTSAMAALAAGAWVLVGSAPRLPHPTPAAPVAAGAALLAGVLAALPRRPGERRFERATLARALPILALYLPLAALWPPLRPLTVWHGALGLTDRVERITSRYPGPLLEELAAFAVLGYAAAEWRGRAELPLAKDVPRLAAVALGAAGAIELAAGFQDGRGASLVRLALVVASALLGGCIYHLQRDHVRFLLRRPPP